MTEEDELVVGSIGWCDLTVEDAEGVRDFYRQTVGWGAAAVSMGDYDDFIMVPSDGADPVAGICHARGDNEGLPAQWLVYIVVEDVDASAERCAQLGGEVVAVPRAMAGGRFCVIRDPAGAVCALWEPPA